MKIARHTIKQSPYEVVLYNQWPLYLHVAGLNSHVSSWFCRTNDPLIYLYPLLNMVVCEKCFKALPLKFYFRLFGDIRSNRKWNLKSAINRKWQPETLFLIGHHNQHPRLWRTSLKLGWGQLFWNLTVKRGRISKILQRTPPEIKFCNFWWY